jgi:aspartokinase
MSENFMVVEKIGGGGSQDAESIILNAERFANDSNLVAVAFSGPGGIYGRATDRMIGITELHRDGKSIDAEMSDAQEQFTRIAEGLGNRSLADATMDEIREGLENGYGYSWLRMRPEFFARRAYQYVLGEAGIQTNLVNPVNSMFVASNGRLDVPRSYKGLQQELHPTALNLVVGFAARRSDMTMDNMSRGSTDLVGAAVSGALNSMYPHRPLRYILRKDDVMGIMRVSPKIDPDAEVGSEFSTGEVEALALGGSEVVHPAVLRLIDDTWLQGEGVVMTVQNTFDTTHPGTRIVPTSKRILDPERPVAGIASQRVDAYKWRDGTADDATGLVELVGGVFAEHEVSITDAQTGQGGVIQIYMSSDEATHHTRLKRDLEVVDGFSATVEVDKAQELVVIVGDALRTQAYLGVLGVLSSMATGAGIEVGSLSHIKREPHISFTLEPDVATDFLRALNNRFFGKST